MEQTAGPFIPNPRRVRRKPIPRKEFHSVDEWSNRLLESSFESDDFQLHPFGTWPPQERKNGIMWKTKSKEALGFRSSREALGTKQSEDALGMKQAYTSLDQQPPHQDCQRISPELSSEKQEPESRKIRGLRWLAVCFAIYSANFLYGLDTTIVANIQPSIVNSLGHIGELAWIGVGFPLGSVAMIMPLGAAYGLFDTKVLFLSSIALFEAGSALCGGAPNMAALIVGRVIAGAGGAGMYLGTLNYVSVLTTPQERSIYNALVGMAFGAGLIIGPVIGGAFAASPLTWRWSFYINLCVAAVAAPISIIALPRFRPRPELAFRDRFKLLDLVGAVLAATVFVLWAIIFTFAGVTWSWSSPAIISLIWVLVIAIGALALQQKFCVLTTRDHRILPGHLLHSRTMVLQFVGNACATGTLYLALYYLPLYFQFADNDSVLKSAVRLLPLIISNIVFIMISGALLPRTQRYMPWYVASGALILLGGLLLYFVSTSTSTAYVYGAAVVIGAGAGLTLQLAYTVVVAKTDAEHAPRAIGLINIAQIGTGTIVLPLASSIFQNVGFRNLRRALAERGFTEQQLRQVLAGTRSETLQQANPQVRSLALKAITAAMDDVYILIIVAGTIALLASFLMKRERLQF